MTEWKRVHWSEAGQVLGMLDKEATGETAALAPSEHFAALRKEEKYDDAIVFLAQALPRFEAIFWAAYAIRPLYTPAKLKTPDGVAFSAAMKWLSDPSDQNRRHAQDCSTAQGAGIDAGASLAMAVFMSGGSIVPDSAPPIQSPPELAGRLAGAAILAAVNGHPERKAILQQALASGDKIAREGIPA